VYEQLRVFNDKHPDFEVSVDRVATCLACADETD